MITIHGRSHLADFEIDLPNNVLFAFNTNTITVRATHIYHDPLRYIVVKLGDASIKAYMHNNKAEICMNSLVRAAASKIKFPNSRVITEKLQMFDEDDEDMEVTDGKNPFYPITIIYGTLGVGQRLCDMGFVGKFPRKEVRHLTIFKYFDNRFSAFAYKGDEYEEKAKYRGNPNWELMDNYGYSYDCMDELYTDIEEETNRYFKISGSKHETEIFCDVSDRKDGIFLRWIDNRGLWYSYLFEKGAVSTKIEQSEYRKSSILTINNVQFEQTSPISISTTKKITCCAVCLDKEHFDDISTIASSVYVEMDVNGVYKRVNIVSSDINGSLTRVLNNIEIEVEIDKTDISL